MPNFDGPAAGSAQTQMPLIEITLRRSPIGTLQQQKDTVVALGLRRIGQAVRHPDNPAIRGMAHSVRHLVEIAIVDEASTDGK